MRHNGTDNIRNLVLLFLNYNLQFLLLQCHRPCFKFKWDGETLLFLSLSSAPNNKRPDNQVQYQWKLAIPCILRKVLMTLCAMCRLCRVEWWHAFYSRIVKNAEENGRRFLMHSAGAQKYCKKKIRSDFLWSLFDTRVSEMTNQNHASLY
jgi:hypothetical protein